MHSGTARKTKGTSKSFSYRTLVIVSLLREAGNCFLHQRGPTAMKEKSWSAAVPVAESKVWNSAVLVDVVAQLATRAAEVRALAVTTGSPVKAVVKVTVYAPVPVFETV